MLKEKFIRDCSLIHQNKYDYSLVPEEFKMSEKVKIICPIHGEFEQCASEHKRGKGCCKCAIELKANKLKYSKEDFINKANIVHHDKYDYTNVNYISSDIKVDIICLKHGLFSQIPAAHLSGQGCPICAKEKISEKLKYDTQTFIKKAIKVHGNLYNYTKSNYTRFDQPIIIICKEHGEFEQKPVYHLQGNGCPKCQNKSQSNLYNKLKENFNNIEILYEVGRQIIPWIGLQRFDIYIPKYNIAIEYDGEQHYIAKDHFGGELGLMKTQELDKLKNEKCKQNGCVLFRMKYDYSESDYLNLINNINNIIKNYET